MISKAFRIARMIVLASFALSSAAWAKTCSNASLSDIYGFLGEGTNTKGEPTASLVQWKFDPSTGKFTGTTTTSIDGVIETASLSGTYAVASNCTVKGTGTINGVSHPFSAVVTSTGGVQYVSGNPGATVGGFLVTQGSPTCSNAGVKGSFGLAVRGRFLSGAPFRGPVILVGELALSVDDSGDGVIKGHIAGSEDGTIVTFGDEPVTGSYSVSSDCLGTATITPKGESELHFSFVVVNGGKELLAIEMDDHTVVNGTLQR